MVGVSPFTLLEDSFSYTSKERVGKQIPSKDILLGAGKPLKETKKVLENENDKQVCTSIGCPLKKKDMPWEKKVK